MAECCGLLLVPDGVFIFVFVSDIAIGTAVERVILVLSLEIIKISVFCRLCILVFVRGLG